MKFKKIVFLTGTRADFGKMKSLIFTLQKDSEFDVHLFVTGMHMKEKYGGTSVEMDNLGMPNVYKFINYSGYPEPDIVFANTISGFGNYVRELKPDMIVVHGDRGEALAGAIVGAFNNILVSHIEGGEISGTLDELVRHAVSKISHLHFVTNKNAKKRLIQMGEKKDNVFIIGSPDLDLMKPQNLPALTEVKKRYDILFKKYAIFIFHPDGTEAAQLLKSTNNIIDGLIESNFNYVVIYPNNDRGTDIILDAYKNKLDGNPRFVAYPSMRFEYFLTLLRNAYFIIGNSSSAIMEAPYYGVPTINIGDRQKNRVKDGKIKSIINCGYDKNQILSLIAKFSINLKRYNFVPYFGDGNSNINFLKIIKNKKIWKADKQKQFFDLDF